MNDRRPKPFVSAYYDLDDKPVVDKNNITHSSERDDHVVGNDNIVDCCTPSEKVRDVVWKRRNGKWEIRYPITRSTNAS